MEEVDEQEACLPAAAIWGYRGLVHEHPPCPPRADRRRGHAARTGWPAVPKGAPHGCGNRSFRYEQLVRLRIAIVLLRCRVPLALSAPFATGALNNRIVIHELTPRHASLEDAYLDLTRESAEYRTAVAGSAIDR